MDANSAEETSFENFSGTSNIRINELASVLDSKFDKLKRELAEESSSQLQTAVKRARLAPTFKKEGCKHQYKHNEEVKEKLEDTNSSIDSNKIQKAKEFLQEDVLNEGIWRELASETHIQDNDYLSSLASSLQTTALHAKAGSTTETYTRRWRRWRAFAQQYQLQAFPVKRLGLALYIQHLLQSAASIAPIDTAIYSLKWTHTLAGILSPTEDGFIIKTVVDGVRRSLARPKSPKEPISPETIAKLVSDKGGQHASMMDLRLIFICIISYAGLLRCNELIALRVRDIAFFPDHMTLHLPKRKNDQLRQGHTVYIAKTGNPTCPVAITERYLATLGIAKSPSHPLVCGLRRSKRGFKPTSKPLSYTTVRELVLKGLAPYVEDVSAVGTNSLRAGGATEAASDTSVNERCIVRQGGWKSEASKDMYIKDTISNKLAVTRAMKL